MAWIKFSSRECGLEAIDRRRFGHFSLFVSFLCLGVIARIFVAWALMESSSSDHGVPCLMVKHIAEGIHFPVFYYGQPYMGSLEPIVGALLSFVFGMNGFSVNLGTALFGIALLPLVYQWGVRAGGGISGLTALLFCVIGPFGFFQFQSWSYGGYAAIVFFCALLVFYASWIVAKEMRKTSASLFHFLGIGVVAGLAWWTAPHTLPAIVTAGVVILAGLRSRFFGWRAFLGVMGFAVGSLPFWIWNFNNAWATFLFLAPGAGGQLLEGMAAFWGPNMIRTLGLPSHYIVWIGYILCLGIFVALLIRNVRPRLSEKGLFMGALLLYLLISSLLAGGSRFSGPTVPVRYLLHVVPPMAVILGVVVRFMALRCPFGSGLLLPIVLVSMHLTAIPVFLGWASSDRAYKAELADFSSFLADHNISDIYAPYPMGKGGYALNFLLKEAFTFSDPRSERYPPYRRKLELTESVAVLNNLHNVDAFIESSGGTAQCCDRAGITLHYNFMPPQKSLVDITEDLSCLLDQDGRDVKSSLLDGEVTTSWHNQPNDGQHDYLEFRWDALKSVHSIQLYSAADLYGYELQLKRLSPEGKWLPVVHSLPEFSSFFWSGGRPYYRGDLYRQAFRFDPHMTRGVRLYINKDDIRQCELTEVRVYAVGDQVICNDAEIISLIGSLGLRRVYADRWMANRIYEAFNGRVATSVDPNITTRPDVRLWPAMQWDKKTGFVASRAMVGLCDVALEAAGFTMSKKRFGDQFLYFFSEDDWAPHYTANHSFIWTGLGCIKRSDRNWAAYLDKYADSLCEKGRAGDALAVLEEAVHLFPGLPFGMERLVSWSLMTGKTERAQYWSGAKLKYEQEMLPAQASPVRFGTEIQLEGVTLLKSEVASDDVLNISYFWRCASSIMPSDWAVFVHFVNKDGHVTFQDDHVLLEGESVSDQPVSVLFRECRKVVIPKDLAPEICGLRLGVYSRTEGGRLVPECSFPVWRRSVELPISIVDSVP